MISETKLCALTLFAMLPATICILRLIVLLPALRVNNEATSEKEKLIRKNAKLMILLGSGGHTGEMLRLLEKTDVSHCSRTWLVSSGDSSSLIKAKRFEENIESQTRDLSQKSKNDVHYAELYRARKVKEPLVLSVVSTLKSIVSTAQQLKTLPSPDVLLVNGPGTSVPVAYLLFLMKFFGLCRTRIIYIESLARVNSLSLSGKLILPIADRFIVQWQPLAVKYKRAEYYGILI